MKRRQARSVVLTALLVASIAAGAVAIPSSTAAAGSPGGMVGVPSENIDSDLPPDTPMGDVRERLEGEVLASENASTLDVTVTNPGRAKKYSDGSVFGGGPIAIVLTDDENHEGREVALPADVLRDVLGYVPERAYGTHESGERWSANTRIEGGSVVFEVPHFSTQTVTFAGEVSLNGSPATNGTSYEYNLSSLDSASDPVVNFTGHTATEWDNGSWSGVSSGSTLDTAVAGNLAPSGPASGSPRVTFVGEASKTLNTYSGRAAMSGSSSVSVGGNVDPRDDVIEITSDRAEDYNGNTKSFSGTATAGDIREFEYSNPTGGEIQRIHMYFEAALYEASTVDVFVEGGPADGDAGGEKIAYLQPDNFENGAWENTSISALSNSTIHVAVQANSDMSDGEGWEQLGPSYAYTGHASSATVTPDSGTGGTYSLNAGETKTVNLSLTTSTTSVSVDADQGAVDYTGEFNDTTITENPSISAPSGTTASYAGLLDNGETATAALNLTLSDDNVDVATDGGTTGVDLALQERTQTVDPGVELNGNTTSYSGTLGDGNTTQLNLSKASLQEGTNRVNVSVGDGTLSSDAPTPSVDLEYTHEAESEKDVDYVGEKLSERYNITHTYASARNPATATIPFAGEVIEVRSVEKRIDGGDWQTVASSAYEFDNTSMTVDLGSISKNTTVDVRAVGSKVAVQDMGIEVLEPTAPGKRLDSKIYVSSVTVGGEPTMQMPNQRLSYTYNETWSADETAVFEGSKQRLQLDGIGAGSEFRVSTIPVRVEPESGDVAIEVESPMTTEPEFIVRAGPGGVDSGVAYTFIEAADDTKYILYSQTNDVVHDSGTANSPLTLEDDDTEETLQFQLDDSNTSSTGGDDDNTGGPIDVESAEDALPVSTPVLLVGVLLVGGIALFVVRRRYGATPTRTAASGGSGGSGILGSALAWTTYTLDGASRYLRGHPYVAAVLGGGALLWLFSAGVVSLSDELQVFLAVSAVIVGSYLLLERTGNFTLAKFGVIAAILGVLALELINPGAISDALGSGIAGALPVLIIAALGGYWLYSKRQKQIEEARTPDINIGSGGDSK